MKAQNFQWNDPYEDVQADNVTHGSVDYYNFHWGEAMRENNASGRNREDCLASVPDGCGCAKPDETRDCTVSETIFDERPAYPIIEL